MFALLTFAAVLVVVEEVLVVIFVVTVDSHSDEADQWANVDRCFFLARRVFRAADRATTEMRGNQATRQQVSNVHVRPFGF